MKKTILLIMLVVLLIFCSGCKNMSTFKIENSVETPQPEVVEAILGELKNFPNGLPVVTNKAE